jgi:hypothetical protein
VLDEVGLGDAQHGRVGRALLVALDDLFLKDVARHLVVELHEHPVEQPPHLGALVLVRGEQAGDRAGRPALLDGMEDREDAHHRRLAGLDEDRAGRGGVYFEQLRLAHPGLGVLELHRHAVFGEHQAGEAGGGVEPVLQQAWHWSFRSLARPAKSG